MFLSALITSSLTVKLKNNAREAAQTAFRTQILFDMNQLLQQERDKKDILEVTAMQLIKLLNRTIVVYEVEKASLSAPHVYYCSEEEEQESYTTEEEPAGLSMGNEEQSSCRGNNKDVPKCQMFISGCSCQ